MIRRSSAVFERRVVLGAVVGAVGGTLLLMGIYTAQHAWPVSVPLHPMLLPQKTSLPAGVLQGVVVILDPGHGGQDSGAVCGSLSEAALTYRTATEVAAELQAQGAEVVYTVRSRTLDPVLPVMEPPPERPTDAVLASTNQPLRRRRSPEPLWQRAATARRIWVQRALWDPQARRNVFFLSLHYDQYHAPGISGSVVCVDQRTHSVPAFAQILAQEMKVGNFERATDFRGIHGVSGHTLGVLNPERNPVPEKALLELATLSNPQDALEAGDSTWRHAMASRITNAVVIVHQDQKLVRAYP